MSEISILDRHYDQSRATAFLKATQI